MRRTTCCECGRPERWRDALAWWWETRRYVPTEMERAAASAWEQGIVRELEPSKVFSGLFMREGTE